ncbi:hypothetical protein JOB18_009918, partial [Solea senegalensis]
DGRVNLIHVWVSGKTPHEIGHSMTFVTSVENVFLFSLPLSRSFLKPHVGWMSRTFLLSCQK